MSLLWSAGGEKKMKDKFLIERIIVNIRSLLERGFQEINISTTSSGFIIIPTKISRIRK